MQRQTADSPSGLRVSQSGRIEVLDGEWREAQIRGRPVALPWLVSVRLELDDGRKHQITLLTDSADTDGLRRLRAWLRWGAALG